MSTTPVPETEAVDQAEPDPAYLALPKSDRDALDELVELTQAMQNDVDKTIAVLGEPVYFIARMMLAHDLSIRTLKVEVVELRSRIRDLADRVS